MSSSVQPFRVKVPQEALDNLDERLAQTIWPSVIEGTGDTYGVDAARVSRLAAYWRESFDWRAFEARLNAYPQFMTEIDGAAVHFIHVRSSRADATPLLLTHGWPGSIIEYLDLIPPLTEPESPEQSAFHLIIPSLPGFGFSGPTTEPGWGTLRTARAWVELVKRLGYDRYGVAGNDAGSMISPEIGRLDGEHVIGVHVTQLFSFPSGDPAEFADLSEEDQAGLTRLQWFYENKFSFNQVQSQQPQTLAFALADSPVGLLAWHAQLLPESLDDEFVIANVAIYWLTGTAGSAIRFYFENAHATGATVGPTTAPTALAMFAGDFQSIRRFAERDHHNIVSWHRYGVSAVDAAEGGHYAAHEETQILAADLREFFAAR